MFFRILQLFLGACVAPSIGKAGWSLPLSLALLAGYLLKVNTP